MKCYYQLNYVKNDAWIKGHMVSWNGSRQVSFSRVDSTENFTLSNYEIIFYESGFYISGYQDSGASEGHRVYKLTTVYVSGGWVRPKNK